MKITVTGATGLIGPRLVARLKDRGDEVTVLSRAPDRAGNQLGVEAVAWDPPAEPAPAGTQLGGGGVVWRPRAEPAPAEALNGRDGVVHLAGEPVAQRWNGPAKQ